MRKRLEVVKTRDTERRNKSILANSSKNPRVFWDLLKQTVGLRRKKAAIPEEVLFEGVVASGDKIVEIWKEAFRRLTAVDVGEKAFRAEFLEEIQQEIRREWKCSHHFDSLNADLNKPINSEEVESVLASLKQGKAAGVDSLVNEIFKFGGEGIAQSTALLCNELFRLERVPKDWARGLIFPLFKDGDNRVPDNYRGITLLSVAGKVYTSVLNKRVSNWCEANGVLSEEQAGFRPNRSTVDHIFTLSELIRARKARRKETHCAFLDIRKAYDTLDRDALWKRLIDVGIRGKMWRVIKNLYDVVESSVLVGQQRTEWFPVEAGVRQGCILSPILFIIFIDGLVSAVKKTRVKSVLEGVRFNIMLFADDVVLLAESKQDLQLLLDKVYSYSQSWRFKWNSVKSKVLRFCPRKLQKQHYFLGLQELEVVKSFKYLGVDFQENLSWSITKKRFEEKAKTRIPMILKAVIEGLSVKTGEKLWHSMIRPTLEYATEVWGGDIWKQADQIQHRVGKTLLGLSKNAAGEVARGELGWLSLKARRDRKQLIYWGKVLSMNESRLAKVVYLRSKDVTDSLKGSFCGSVKRTLLNLKLGHLWNSQAVGDLKSWISFISAVIRKKDQEDWFEEMKDKKPLVLYRNIKTEVSREDYLEWQIPACHRTLYARLRSGAHNLRLATGRYIKEPEPERLCVVCVTGKVETEEHFMLDCYVYAHIRERMFARIKDQTGYDLLLLKEDKSWLLDVLLGHGLRKKEVREKIGIAVTTFIAVASKIRRQYLGQEH